MTESKENQAENRQKIVGVDIGYGFTKIKSDSQQFKFPAIVGQGEDLDFQSAILSDDELLNNLNVVIDNEKYFVGQMALRESAFKEFTTNKDRSENKEMEILTKTALSLLVKDNNTEFKVVTGLPVEDYTNQKESVIKTIKGELKVKFILNNKQFTKKAKVSECIVIPQPMGTFYNILIDFKDGQVKYNEDFKEARIGIIDPGHLTTDFILIDQMKYVNRQSTSINVGLGESLELIRKEFMSKYNRDIKDYEMLSHIENGYIKNKGERVSLDKYEEKFYQGLANEITSKAKRIWDVNGIDYIYVTGGAAQSLVDLIDLNLTKSNCLGQLSNVEGFYKAGQVI